MLGGQNYLFCGPAGSTVAKVGLRSGDGIAVGVVVVVEHAVRRRYLRMPTSTTEQLSLAAMGGVIKVLGP
jgi:hypothetical protein